MKKLWYYPLKQPLGYQNDINIQHYTSAIEAQQLLAQSTINFNEIN